LPTPVPDLPGLRQHPAVPTSAGRAIVDQLADEGRSPRIDTPVLQQSESLWHYPSGYGSAFAD